MDQNQSKNSWCVTIDGSKFSNYGWEMTLENLLKGGDQIYIVHISSNDDSRVIPYESQPLTLKSKYETICKGKYPPLNYQIILEKRSKGNDHALEDLYRIAKSKNVTCIVMGFQGHKANVEKKELSKGIQYMIQNIRIPVLIVKELTLRKESDTKGLNWLICCNPSRNSRTYLNSLKVALTQIDKQHDMVIGMTITKYQTAEKMLVQEDFENICKESGIKNCSFRYVLDDKSFSIGQQVANYVNFGEERIDFVGLGYPIGKYENVDDAPAINIIKIAITNVLFCPLKTN